MENTIKELRVLVEQHDKDIQAIQHSTATMIQVQRDVMMEQKETNKAINGLTLSLQRYIDKHDSVNRELLELAGDVRELRDMQHTNQPLIDGIRAIHGKLLLVVISALASPAAIMAILATTTKGG